MENYNRIWRRTLPKLTAFVMGVSLTGAAFAHVFPQHQEPGAGATVMSPAKVKIVFGGSLEPAFTSMIVTDSTGKQVNAAQATVDPQERNVVSLALPTLPAGHYTVHWIAVAEDGHRTQGDYSFGVKS
jgi:methionine-rich copper-binding protein CopC